MKCDSSRKVTGDEEAHILVVILGRLERHVAGAPFCRPIEMVYPSVYPKACATIVVRQRSGGTFYLCACFLVHCDIKVETSSYSERKQARFPSASFNPAFALEGLEESRKCVAEKSEEHLTFSH